MMAAFGVAVLALRDDWADGVQVASIAGAAPLVGALVAGVALLLRRRAQGLMLALTAALMLVLTLASASAWLWPPPLHALQAHALEVRRQWLAAIYEFDLSGE